MRVEEKSVVALMVKRVGFSYPNTLELFGDTRISKSSPFLWLENFVKTHSPVCSEKYVYLDQGGENPRIVFLI
jgi:hypothetical protein